MWYEGRFAFEYKGRRKDLNAAYVQLLQYREPLGNPPLLVVTDTRRYEVHTNFTGTVKSVYRFTNAELPRPENLKVLRALFYDPDALRPSRTVEGVTEEAAAKFARLADGLRARGVEPYEAAHFLNKLLFCLFAEDIGLLPKGLFTKVVERTRKEPERFEHYARDLFSAMRSGGDFLLEDTHASTAGSTRPVGSCRSWAGSSKRSWRRCAWTGARWSPLSSAPSSSVPSTPRRGPDSAPTTPAVRTS